MWQADWGTFSDFANNATGKTAVEACCACGGGREICMDVENYTSSAGIGCAVYAEKGFCNVTSNPEGYGPNWQEAWGTFDNWKVEGGLSPRQACCACGGGRAEVRRQDAIREAALKAAMNVSYDQWGFPIGGNGSGWDMRSASDLYKQEKPQADGRVVLTLTIKDVDFLNASLVDPFTEKIQQAIVKVCALQNLTIKEDDVDVLLSAYGKIRVTINPPAEVHCASVKKALSNEQTTTGELAWSLSQIQNLRTFITGAGDFMISNMSDPVIEAVYIGAEARNYLAHSGSAGFTVKMALGAPSGQAPL
jgi:hypothetical protein